MADLNSALHSCRCGAFVRDDLNMRPEWKVQFTPANDPGNLALPRPKQKGEFFYVRPDGTPGHRLMISDAMRASACWRTVL